MQNSQQNLIILIDPRKLKPHEEISLKRAIYLLLKIIFEGSFTTPLLIDLKTKTILDGHHRCWVAKKLNFKNVPCYGIDYLIDQSVQVYQRREDIFVDKIEVINMALADKKFPRKTTRHEYKIPAFEPLVLHELWK